MEEIVITGCTSELKGVGRLPDGRAVFVRGALPGERVGIEVTQDKGRFCEAECLSVSEPSPKRREPVCPHYGKCGGCSALHMDYACSLELKRQAVFDALVRIGGIKSPNVLETLGADEPFRYRNKAEYAIGMYRGRLVAGLNEAGGRGILPVEDCLLQKEDSLRALNALNGRLDRSHGFLKYLVTRINRRGEMMLIPSGTQAHPAGLKTLADDLKKALPTVVSLYYCALKPRPTHALDGTCSLITGRPVLTDELLGLSFELSPQSFFQINPFQTEVLYRKALEAASVSPGARVVDAYCGVGTISLAAAQTGAYVLGVEIVPPAIENAKRNALINGLENRTEFVCADAAKLIPQRIAKGERFDAAIIDPPRKGAEAALLNALAEARVPRIAYVSCNPATLARDVKLLSSQGYRLEWAQPVDMFCQTHHVETVASLHR